MTFVHVGKVAKDHRPSGNAGLPPVGSPPSRYWRLPSTSRFAAAALRLPGPVITRPNDKTSVQTVLNFM
jgi:hypothetical protein